MDPTVTAHPQGSQAPPLAGPAIAVDPGDSDRELTTRTLAAITVHGELFGEQDLLDIVDSIERFGPAQVRTWIGNWREIKADADHAERQRRVNECEARR
jgi:hypothetical protein